jgi:Zn-dependent membrane protease YugP
MTGADVARQILNQSGIYDVSVQIQGGRLSDHYDPRRKVLKLSSDVYNGRSLAALGVAAHECGHAIQHDVGYAPLALRNAIVPAAGIGSPKNEEQQIHRPQGPMPPSILASSLTPI